MIRIDNSSRRWRTPLYVNTILIQVVVFVLRPTAIYRAIELGVSSAWLGALGASFAVLPLLFAVPVGHIADRFGERRVMIGGAGITVLATLVLSVMATNVVWLLCGVMLLGAGHLGSAVAQQALVANRTPQAKFDSAFGYYAFAVSLGQSLGPALIVLFGGRSAIPDTGAIFFCGAILSLFVLVAAMAVPSARVKDTEPAGSRGSLLDLVRLPGLLSAIAVSSIIIAAVDITLVYLPVLGTEKGISAGVVGVLLSVRAVSSMLSRLFLGKLVTRFGRLQVLLASVILSAVTMATLAVPMPVSALMVATVLLGLGLGVGQPLTMSLVAEATPRGRRGRAMSLRLMGNRLGQVVVPSAAGLLAVGAGATGVLCVTAASLFGAAIVTRRIVGGGQGR